MRMSVGRTHFLAVLMRSCAYMTAECFDKIAYLVKAAVKSDVGNARIARDELLAGALYTITVDIFYRSLARHAVKERTEIFRSHSRRLGKVSEHYSRGIVFLDISDNSLEWLELTGTALVRYPFAAVEMTHCYDTDKLQDSSLNDKLKAVCTVFRCLSYARCKRQYLFISARQYRRNDSVM